MADDEAPVKKKSSWNKGKGDDEEKETKKKSSASAKTEENPDFKYIVRVANTDLDGKFQVVPAIATVKGLGIRTAAVVASRSGVNPYQKIGNLTDADVVRLGEAIDGIAEGLPAWMLNRRKDIDTGEDQHIIGTDVEIRLRDDLNRLKKIRTNRGLRHEGGQKVRGQRSKSNGRTGLTLGVMKQKQAQPAGEKKE
ncbi:MAG: 30S ribosomal protein S13 [Candidatus Thermoplasmatota archaeon]